MTPRKPGAQRVRESEERKRETGLCKTSVWCRPEDRPSIHAYAKTLRGEKKTNGETPTNPITQKVLDIINHKLTPHERQLLQKSVEDVVAHNTAETQKRLNEEYGEVHARERELKDQWEKAIELRRSLPGLMHRDDFKYIRGLLHPDKNPGEEEKYKKAFLIFDKLRSAINWKLPPRSYKKSGWNVEHPRRRK